MKRILFYLALAVVIVAGCTKEEPKTTYSFITQDGIVETTTAPLYDYNYYNIAMNVVFAEYGAGHRIAFQKIDGIVDGQKYVFEADPNTEYVTVRIDVKGDHDRYESMDYTKYFGNVIFLEKGKNTEITFTPTTMVTNNEPK